MPSTESLRRALAVGVPGMSRRYSWRLAVAVAYAADDDEDDGGRGAGGPLAFVGVVEEAEDKTEAPPQTPDSLRQERRYASF